MTTLPGTMQATYSSWLVALSFMVAILVAYTALSLSARVAASKGSVSQIWLAGGAMTMGIGIWAMHFIGMLAFSLPITLRYDVTTTFASLGVAVCTSAGALWNASGPHLSTRRLVIGAMLMGSGIAAMHYLGMSAIRIVPLVSYDSAFVALSILIAIGASFTALWLAFNLRSGSSMKLTIGRLVAASVMGLAIGGMHYTGMAAVSFQVGSYCVSGVKINNQWLGIVIGSLTVGLLSITLIVAVCDDYLKGRLSSEAKRLAAINAQLEQQGIKTRLAMRDLEYVHFALDHVAAVAVTDVHGSVTYVNDRFCELSLFSRDELMGQNLAVLKSGAHSPEAYAQLLTTVRSGVAWHGELCSEKKNGERYWVDVAVVPYKDESGETVQYVTIRTDITANKLAIDELAAQEQRSRLSEERLRQIADSLPAMISYWDSNLICQFANQAYFQRFGLTPAEMVGMSFSDVFRSELDTDRQARVRATLLGHRQRFYKTTMSTEGRIQHWQGDYLPHWQQQLVAGFYILVIEITERKNAEERIARQEALLAATSRIGEIAGWELDADLTLPTTSPMFATICEFPPDHQFTLEDALERYPTDARAMIRDCIDAALIHGLSFDHVTPFVTAKGNRRWVRSIGEPQNNAGAGRRLIGALQDVTRYKELEMSLVQAQKLESIGHLAAGIAHEINTPTQFIGNNVDFLQGATTDLFQLIEDLMCEALSPMRLEERSVKVQAVSQRLALDYLRTEVPLAISQSADGIKRISEIVGAMKEFSHPATEKALTDLNRAIESTVIVASNEWKYVADLRTELDPELGLVAVMPGRFNQVVLNIIVNAAHAISSCINKSGLIEKGTINISTRRLSGWAEIRISDTGCGMPEHVRTRIFDPFFTTKPVGHGTGQGLSIAHDVIVKAHGGSLHVESQEGKGSTFVIRLPLKVESASGSVAA